jgi:xanthosine phosphorylase
MRDLIEAAERARGRAWAPYSGFKVGAAIRTPSGAIHLGCNVENLASPQGQCAEATAIGAMVAAGESQIREIAIVGSGTEPCAPCGGCRQRIAEFAKPDTVVHMAAAGGLRVTSLAFAALLPHPFALPQMKERVMAPQSAAEVVRSRLSAPRPRVGLILGSGLKGVAASIRDSQTLPWSELPGFPQTSVPGHEGRLVLGRLGGIEVACLLGRIHLYEGHAASAVLPLMQLFRDLGCGAVVLTNAAGSLRPELGPGRIVRLIDHINFQGTNPLVALCGPEGPPFLDLSSVYDRELGELVDAAASALGIELEVGIYLATLGPCFETPAEIRAFRALGADLVGMSTVMEAIAARFLGLRVIGLSIVTNLAAGLTPQPLSHAQTVNAAASATASLTALLEAALPAIAHRSSRAI